MDYKKMKNFVFCVLCLLQCTRCQMSNATESNNTSANQLPPYFEQFQKLLQNVNMTGIQHQLQNVLQLNNLTSSVAIMTPGNLQKLVGLMSSGVTIPNGFQLQDLLNLVAPSGNADALRGLADIISDNSKNVSSDCIRHLQQLATEASKMTPWAIQMIDATGKISSEVMNGNLWWLGSYDECLEIESSPKNMDQINGKYCSADLQITALLGSLAGGQELPPGVVAHLGICVPDSCSASDVKVVFDILLQMLPLGENKPSVQKLTCPQPAEYDGLGIAGLTVCGVFVFLMVMSTIFDIFYQNRLKKTHESATMKTTETDLPSKYNVNRVSVVTTEKCQEPGLCGKLATSFSVYTNGKKLLNTTQAGGALGAVNGIRFLSISWVVLGHVFSFGVSVFQNPTYYQDFLASWSGLPIINGLLSVDSFFTLSGLLVSYLFMRQMEKEKGKINWFMFYFHRFWRLTPAYLLVMFMDISLFRYMGDGPLWNQDGAEKDFCKETFWTNILYVNNLVKADKMCFGWSWYLANDMQFYVISPILLVPLFFWKKIGIAINVLALVAITIATAVVHVKYDLLPSMFSTDFARAAIQRSHYGFDYYMVPWCRMGPYIVGIVTGYCLYQTKGVYKISKAMNVFVWVLMTLLAVLIVYGIYDPVNGRFWSTELSALYGSTHRTVWGMCVCWVIFACVTGNGGFVNDLLSWEAFVPLGRLSYGIYLVHPLVLFHFFQTIRGPIFGSSLSLTYIFLGSLVLSTLIAFVASLAFEAPMMALEKAIFRRDRK